MSPREWKNRIHDILVCAKNILIFTDGMSLVVFINDPKTIRAVAFELTTIGEAAKAISLEIQEKYAEIPWVKLQGILNK